MCTVALLGRDPGVIRGLIRIKETHFQPSSVIRNRHSGAFDDQAGMRFLRPIRRSSSPLRFRDHDHDS